MRSFTHDCESVVLTETEMLVFSTISVSEAHRDARRRVSDMLAAVQRPMGAFAVGYVVGQAVTMWRNLEDPG